MIRFYLPLFLATSAVVLSQYLQKVVARHVHPLAVMVVVYAIAFTLSLTGLTFTSGRASVVDALREVSWPSYLLGIVILGFESSSLLAFRAGWKIGSFALVVNAASAVLLLPMAYFVFREKLTPSNWLGIAFCLGGIALLARE
jgi:uncharacterized membrane protein